MLVAIRKILAYLDWLALIAFIVIFGILLIQKNVTAGVITLIFAISIIIIMIAESSKRYFPQNRVSGGKPLGNPLVDVGIAVYGFVSFSPDNHLNPLYIAGIIMVTIDFLLWMVNGYEQMSGRKK